MKLCPKNNFLSEAWSKERLEAAMFYDIIGWKAHFEIIQIGHIFVSYNSNNRILGI